MKNGINQRRLKSYLKVNLNYRKSIVVDCRIQKYSNLALMISFGKMWLLIEVTVSFSEL